MSEGMRGNIPLSETRGPRNELDIRLAGPQGRNWLRAFNRMLRGEPSWGIPKYPEHFEVTADGRTGKQFADDLVQLDIHLGELWMPALLGKHFVVINGGTYKLVVIRGDDDDLRLLHTNRRVRAVACSRGLVEPPLGLAPYVCELFCALDFKAAGLNALIVMHDPFSIGHGLGLLGFACSGGKLCFDTFVGAPVHVFSRETAYIFMKPVDQPVSPDTDSKIDTMVRVNRAKPPDYPEWVGRVTQPDLEGTGPADYDLGMVDLWLHDGQKEGLVATGQQIYSFLCVHRMLESCLGLQDALVIQRLGVAAFQKAFGNNIVFFWKSVAWNRKTGILFVSSLHVDRDEVVLCWRPLNLGLNSDRPAARFRELVPLATPKR